MNMKKGTFESLKECATEVRIQALGFGIQCPNHQTIEPYKLLWNNLTNCYRLYNSFVNPYVIISIMNRKII